MSRSRHSAFTRLLVSAALVASAGVGTVALAAPSQAADFTVSITDKPDDPSASTSASFGFSSDDPDVTFTCSVDSATPVTCTSPYAVSGLSDMQHDFDVVGTDGTTMETNDQDYTWTVDTTGPTLSISSAATGTIATTSATINFTAGADATSVQCALNAGAFADCDTTASDNFTGLTEGTNTLRVRAVDALGNKTDKTVTRTVDTMGPSVTLTGPSGTVASTTADITFTVGNDATTITCSLDSATPTTCTSPQVVDGLDQGPHTFDVTATDAVGNPTTKTLTWTVDTVGPTLVISSAPTATIATTSATIVYTAGSDAVSVQCAVDAGAFTACGSSTGNTFTGLTEATHTLRVRAIDAVGNATDKTVTRTVDLTPPSLTISSAATATVNTTSVTIAYTAEAGATLTCAVDNGTFTTCGSNTSNTFSNLAETTASTVHTLRVRATDAAGNTTDKTVTREVDTTAPAAKFDQAPSGVTKTRSANFAFSATDVHSVTFQCALDNTANYQACTSPVPINGTLPNGTHTAYIKATDAAGNTSTITRTWTVNLTCTLSIPAKVVIGTSFTFLNGKLGSDCGTTFQSANWDFDNPSGQAVDNFDFFGPGSLTTTINDVGPLGTFTVKPTGSTDASGLGLSQNKVSISVRLASRLALSGRRHAKKVTLSLVTTKYVPGAGVYRPWAGRRVTIQYRTCATCTWHTLRSVASNKKGKATFTITAKARRFYRAIGPDTSTIWGSTTSSIKR
ncbi:MAG TPA: hypothetical protein VFE15_06205 [Marmoricola sp.]|jgi:hypothetical protein|nr:hypothetical protein [Marmoricola sp.]